MGLVACGGSGGSGGTATSPSPSVSKSEARLFAEKQQYAAWRLMTEQEKVNACLKGVEGGGKQDIAIAAIQKLDMTQEQLAESRRIGPDDIGWEAAHVQSEILQSQCDLSPSSP